MGMTIKEFRLSQKLSQPKLAKALGIGVSTVGAYEVGKIKPSKKVYAKIKEVFGVDISEAAAAAPTTTVEAAAVEAAPAPAPVETTPAVEEKQTEATPAPAKKTRKAKAKKEKVEAAPVETTPAPVPAVEENAEATPAPTPAKKTRAKKATPAKQTAPAPAKKTDIVIQSPMGGEITTEDILTKVGDVDKVYGRVDQNAIYWVKGDTSGAVNIW